MTKSKIILLLFLSLIVWDANAQNNTLKGSIVDENSKALEYVTIRLLKSDSILVNHAISDSLGNYYISGIEKGNYLLAFSSIG